MKSRYLAVSGMVLVAGLTAAATPSAAQTVEDGSRAQPDPTAFAPDAIIVTARRREELLEKVPVAITALTGAAVDELVINNVQDLNKIAGLNASACTYSRECFEPALRGQGTSFATGQASVVPYFAEVAGFQPSFYDLESLQVVKGPQGTLFGETATGGVLLYQPRKPTNDFSGYANVQLGRLDYRQFEGAVGGALIEDRLMVRVAGQIRKRDGFTKAIYSDGSRSQMIDNIDKRQWRISILGTPTDNTELYFVYAGSQSKSRGNSSPLLFVDPRFINPGIRNLPLSDIPSLAAAYEFATGVAPPAGASYADLMQDALNRQNAAGARTQYVNFNLANENRFEGYVGQFRWDISDAITFKNIFGIYATRNKGSATDQDGVDLPLLDVRGYFEPGTTSITNGNRPFRDGWPTRTWTNEAQLLGTAFNERLTWQAGFYYRKRQQREFQENGGFLLAFGNVIADPLPAATCALLNVASPCSSMTRASATSYAGYGQATFAVTDRLNLTAGVRQTWSRSYSELTATETVFVDATSSYFPGQTFPQAIPISGRSPSPGADIIRTKAPNEKEVTYTLTADWQATDDVLLYLAHRKGYKGGGVNSNAPVTSELRTFSPETITDVEFGAKARFEAGGVRGNASIAAYRGNYKNVQRIVILPGGGGQTLTDNVAAVRIQGLEFEGSVSPSRWLTISGSFTYTDAKYKNWVESTTCAATFYYDSCAGLPGTTPVTIDHARGLLGIDGNTIRFKPDLYGDTSKYMWSIQPRISFDEWIGEDISVTGNIYHRSKFIGGNNPSNNALLADIDPLTSESFLGTLTNAYVSRPGYTVADLRFDWRNINDSPFSVSGVVTNLANKKYNISGSSAFSITGTVTGQISEPRLWYLQARYEF